MQHKYLGSLKYFFLSLLIYLPKQSVCLCFALLCISFSFWPATSRSHPCWVARAICSPNARDESPPDPAKAHHRLQNGNKTKQKSFKLALWHLRASTFTQSLSPPPNKADSQDVPDSFSCSPGSFNWREFSVAQVSVRALASLFPVMCLSACRSVHFLSSSCCRVTEWQLIWFSSYKYFCR